MNGLKGTLMAATAVLLLGIGATANAMPITGEITIAASVDGSNLGTRTDVDYFTGTGSVIAATGDFAALGSVTVNDFTFNPLPVGGATVWSGGGFSFLLTSVTINTQNASFLDLSGTGTMAGAGLDSTSYNWSFNANNSGGTLTIASQTNSSVPEPMSLLLLGSGLVGLGLARRKFGRS